MDAAIDPSLEGKGDAPLSSFSIALDDPLMLECFLNHPDPNDIIFPLDYALLQQQQFDDLPLQYAHDTQPNQFPIHNFGEVQLVCYVSNPAVPWRIVIPTQALNNMV